MKVLLVSFFTEWLPHLGTELEIAQVHLDQGDEVVFLGCDGAIGACLLNKTGAQHVCDECRLRRAHGLNMLRPRVTEYHLDEYMPEECAAAEALVSRSVIDAGSAKAFRYRGHDLGWGALSSTIMELRDPNCDSLEARRLLQQFAIAAIRSYLSVQAFLQAHDSFDCAYIFNGRFACTRGALRACEETGIPDIRLHERGSSIRTYELYHGCLPHDRAWWQQKIERAWLAAADDPARLETGKMYFELRRRGSPGDWKSFTKDQDVNLLPADWDGRKTNIGIFTSSEDEFAGIGDEWRNPIYQSQTEGIERIVAEARSRYPNAHFYVRMHPNLKGIVNGDVQRLRSLRSSNVTLIDPGSPISTYTLLDHVDRVLTFGSTIGIEATFWGKISILAGRSIYEHLDVVHLVESHDSLMQMLGAPLSSKPIDDAVKYGFYMQTFGIPFKHWQASSFTEGTFKGRSLRWRPTTTLERRILVRCLEAGVHNATVEQLMGALSKAGSTVWNAPSRVAGMLRQ